METKQLILTVKELNNLFGLTPPIDLKLPSKELQEMVAVQAAPLLNAKGEDVLTEDATEVLRELIPQYMDQYDKETLRIFGVYDLLPDKKEGKKSEEDESPAEDTKDEKESLVEEVEMADRLADLKDIAKEYDEFKGIRGVLTKYNDVKKLREMMLDFLSKVTGKTEDSRNEKEEVKKETGKTEPVTTKKPTTIKKGAKASNVGERVDFFTPLIAKGSFTKEQLIEKAEKQFPDISRSTLQTFLTDAKNPKYNKFAKLVVQDGKGVLSFKK